ncbi:MAG TPA: ElyC/SanA/YdcF family protein, partial [Bacillota bacterium]|nr:ElyC/SanA/YdcF family protein [Bacillota bacterium]
LPAYFNMKAMTDRSKILGRLFDRLIRFLLAGFALILGLALALSSTIFYVYLSITLSGNAMIRTMEQLPPKVDCIIVPGASVIANRRPSPMLQDRLDGAVELYRAGFSERILVSGDHREDNYNEPLVMHRYLVEQGIPDQAILMDHYGLDTYDTIFRAKNVFRIDTAIIATQRFHLQRALFLADRLGVAASGYATDPRLYASNGYMIIRELGARLKAVYEIRTGALPAYSSPPFSFEGDGRLTRDPF